MLGGKINARAIKKSAGRTPGSKKGGWQGKVKHSQPANNNSKKSGGIHTPPRGRNEKKEHRDRKAEWGHKSCGQKKSTGSENMA